MAKFEKGKPNPGRKFQPGQSGNPAGRPKAIYDVGALAREGTMEAIDMLRSVVRDLKAPTSARVSAGVAILERGWGKAPQTVHLRRDGDMKGLTDDELIAIAAGTVADPNGSADPSATPGDQGPLN